MALTTQMMRGVARGAMRGTAKTPVLRRGFASGHEERTQQTLKTSSRLTWLTVTAAALATSAYYFSSSSSSSSSSTPAQSLTEKISHTKHPDLEAPKPVEDRHGDTVAKHAMAAKRNQTKVREGVFKGGEFDNHVLGHSTDPGKDFEKKTKE